MCFGLARSSQLGPGNTTLVQSVEHDGDVASATDSPISPQTSSKSGSESVPKMAPKMATKMAPAQDTEKNENGKVDLPPSFIRVAKPYMLEQEIQKCMAEHGLTQAKEDNLRLLGVAWIDTVRKALQLPVKTYNVACVYYHKFRLSHADTEYGYIDASAAALFLACKIEDTLKKSKEILCAAYNLKLSPAEHVSQDDPMFESPAKTLVGLERLIIEAARFDFRIRYPQKLVIKLAKFYNVGRTVGYKAYYMSLDLYRTFAPLKETTATMAFACLELSGRVLGQNIPDVETGTDYANWHVTREEVMETLLDLLDLYTHHRTSTIVGQEHALDIFIDTRIILNQEASTNNYPRYTASVPQETAPNNGIKAKNGTNDMNATKSPVSPSDPSTKDSKLSLTTGLAAVAGPKGRAGVKDGTIRFMFDPERAREEEKIVAEYFKDEEEEYEVEVEAEPR